MTIKGWDKFVAFCIEHDITPEEAIVSFKRKWARERSEPIPEWPQYEVLPNGMRRYTRDGDTIVTS